MQRCAAVEVYDLNHQAVRIRQRESGDLDREGSQVLFIFTKNLRVFTLRARGCPVQARKALVKAAVSCLLMTQSGHWTTVQLDIADHISENRLQRHVGWSSAQ
jgi:hypothetical protein